MKFKLLESFTSVDLIQTIDWLNRMEIKNYTINDDGTVDVDGGVDIRDRGLTEIPVQFGRVIGWFSCSNNQLTSLEGAPKSVGGSFYCSNNQLTSLEGAPKSVGGWFYCSYNQLTSLEGAPREVGGEFWCYNNKTRFSVNDVRRVSSVGGQIRVLKHNNIE